MKSRNTKSFFLEEQEYDIVFFLLRIQKYAIATILLSSIKYNRESESIEY